MAFPFMNGIYVAHVLLPANIGSVTAANNLAQYFVILAFLGIPTYGMREIAKVRNDQDERNRVYSELFIINLISTIVFSLIYIGIICSVEVYRSQIDLYLISGLAIALNAINVSWLFEGMEEFKFISLRNIFFKLFAFILLILFIRKPDDYKLYALISIIGTAGNAILNLFYIHKLARFSLQGLNFRRHMKSILLLVTVNLAIELYSLMDITMMNFMCSKESIAFYKYGHQIEKMLLQIVNTFTIVLIPRITYYYNEKMIDHFNILISKAMRLIIIVAVPMIVGLYFTSDFLLVKMYGEQYIVSAYILKLFSILLLISPIGYLLGSRVLLVTGHEKLMPVSVGIGACVNLIGNFMLIPRYGEYGATFASIISEVVVMIVYVYLGKDYYRLVNIRKTVYKVIISAAIIGAYLYSIRLLRVNGWITLSLQIIGAMIVYFGVLLLTREDIILGYYEKVLTKLKIKRRYCNNAK